MLAADNVAYFTQISADANEWIRMYREVDQKLRSSLKGDIGPEMLCRHLSTAVREELNSATPSIISHMQKQLEDDQTKHASRITGDVAQRIQASQRDVVLQVEQLMRSTTSEAINSRLIELSDKINHTFTSIMQEAGDIKATTQKMSNHQLRYESTKCSATKGNIAQDEYFAAMDKHFSTAEIIRRHEEGGKCADFEIIQTGREPVIIDVKKHERKIDKANVDKFIIDIKANRKHGALVSMSHGITKRNHFEFEVVENKYIAVFVCNAGCDMQVLETALNIIHWVDGGLKRFTSDEVVRIQPHTVQDICHQLRQHVERVKGIQQHMQQSDKLCRDLLSIDNIHLQLLHAAPGDKTSVSTPGPVPTKYHCTKCDQHYSTPSNFNAHLKKKSSICADVEPIHK